VALSAGPAHAKRHASGGGAMWSLCSAHQGSAAPTSGTDEKVQGGGRFELEESKGEAPDLEEGAKSHRGGATPVGWRVWTVMVAFPRRWHASVVDDVDGRHPQHRRGEGQNQLA
jgi:hypothetical protein